MARQTRPLRPSEIRRRNEARAAAAIWIVSFLLIIVGALAAWGACEAASAQTENLLGLFSGGAFLFGFGSLVVIAAVDQPN